jgi:hypothetical protein
LAKTYAFSHADLRAAELARELADMAKPQTIRIS